MASVSWQYPEDQLIALAAPECRRPRPRRRSPPASISPSCDFRYAIEGDNPPWRPLRAFDDGSQGLYRVPARHRAGRDAAAVRHRTGRRRPSSSITASRQNYYIVDRLFAAAELRLGGERSAATRPHRPHRREAAVSDERHEEAAPDPIGRRAIARADAAAATATAARHAAVAQGADRRCGAVAVAVSGALVFWALAERSPPQRRAPRSFTAPTSHHGRRPGRPAEGLYRPAAPGAAARPAAARRPRPAHPQRRRRVEHGIPAGPTLDPEAQRRAQEIEAARLSRLFAQTNHPASGARLRRQPRRATADASAASGRPRSRRSTPAFAAEHAGPQARLPQRFGRSSTHRQSDRLEAPALALCRAGRHGHPGGADHRHPLRPARPDHRPGHGERL